jgi:pyruvate formate-lyase/glycerol dehydratase family glycyl radical enzyme
MNQRIWNLKESVYVQTYPICIEKFRLLTESFKNTEHQPQVLRNAKAIAHILEHFPIFIEESELIVGNPASKPMGVEFTAMQGVWSKEEIDRLGQEEHFSISSEEGAEIQILNEYWKGKTFYDRELQLFDDERLWPYVQLGVVLPPWQGTRTEWKGGGICGGGYGIHPEIGFGLVAPDWEKAIKSGLSKIIEEAEEELRNTRRTSIDAIKKVDFLQAVIIVHRAIISFANRFADLATEMARKEADPVRKMELEQLSEICRWVPAEPARSFYEALQSLWFVYLVVNPSNVISLGRFDQYMYPFYRKDIEERKLTNDDVLELLECFRIKTMQITITGGRALREKWSGLAKWQNCVLGGQTPDGKDATNELTYLLLEAAKDCQTPHHTLTLRVHEGTPEALMLKALEVVKTGIGMPAFVGDQAYMGFLLGNGVPLELARDYIVVGCIDVALPGRSRIGAYPMFVVPRVFDIFMHNGVDPKTGRQVGLQTGELESFKSFDDLLKAFKLQLAYFMERHAEYNNIFFRCMGELFPQPLTSSLMVDGIRVGKELRERVFPLETGEVINAVGMINVVDSLAAMKKLVFDERRVSMTKLKVALDANWQGDGYEEMRKLFLGAPKFGNDDDFVDSVAKDLYQFWADTVVTFPTVLGAKQKPSAISISAQWPGGAETGATPDGRYAGECLADGTLSAMRGRDSRGPTAVIKSAAKINQQPFQATLLNMKFHPSALKGAEEMRKLANLIKIYFSMGGKHIQFNVVSRETLLDAQKHPENNRDLIVRVAGYSAYFVQLGKEVQNEVIGRTEYEKTA